MKTCNRCLVSQPVENFRADKKMTEGRANQCKSCVREWFKAHAVKLHGSLLAYSRAKYKRRKELGLVVLKGTRSLSGIDPIKLRSQQCRGAAKRRARYRVTPSELDAFAFDEAHRLRVMRERTTGILWAVDHVIPLHHKNMSGLHRGLNVQVVPRRWNMVKNNKSTEAFWPLKTPATAGM